MYELRPLSAPLAKRSAKELNETPENVEHKLSALKEWTKTQTHIRFRTDDQFLIVFLRGAKFNLEYAKKKLENFYVNKIKMPELFYGRNPYDPKVYTIFKLGGLVYLPLPVAPDGPRVVMIRPNRFDLTKHTVLDVFIVGAMLTDILFMKDDNAVIAGYVVIMDLKNVPKDVILQFNPMLARNLTMLANNMSPGRMKGFHLLNPPAIFEKIYNMVKGVIKEKLRDRIYIHNGNLETLYEHIPRHVLTKEYDGELDDSSWADEWWQKFQDNANLLKEEETYGVVKDIKNIDKLKSDFNNDVFGVEGSFRKLAFD